ncbi:MAG: chemotaxis protein CheW [Leptolyngbyaceae cyanobacterium MO_188.B28]|nr:chemotaxis protein CheW [Leptolyngbyaceae cyanobacterium MO_188.B28]
MAFSSISRLSRRTKQKSTEPFHKLIVFKVRQELFALPILAAHKVVELGKIYGNVQGGTAGLTRYQDRELPVIDIEQRIFGTSLNPLLPGSSETQALSKQASPSNPSLRHLLIIRLPLGDLIGLPLSESPQLRRMPESAFAPLPAIYREEGIIRCVNALITPSAKEPSIFLLDLNQLLPNRSRPHPANPVHTFTGASIAQPPQALPENKLSQ